MDPLFHHNLTACPYCDLVFKRHHLAQHEVSLCPRCHSKVEQERNRCPKFLHGTLLAALLFYFPANFYPLVSVEIAGTLTMTSVFDGVLLLVQQNNPITAAIVLFCSLLVPTLVLTVFSLLLVARCVEVRVGVRVGMKVVGIQHFCVRLLVHLRDWSMLDIYLLSFLVTIFKIKDMGEVQMQIGIVAFVGLTMSINKLFISYDRTTLWRLVSDKDSDEKR